MNNEIFVIESKKIINSFFSKIAILIDLILMVRISLFIHQSSVTLPESTFGLVSGISVVISILSLLNCFDSNLISQPQNQKQSYMHI